MIELFFAVVPVVLGMTFYGRILYKRYKHSVLLELEREERYVDARLYSLDPEFAIELGYTPPETKKPRSGLVRGEFTQLLSPGQRQLCHMEEAERR